MNWSSVRHAARRALARLAPLAIVLSGFQQAGYASVFQNWIQHRDPAGFTVQYPQGYTVEQSQGPTVVNRSPDRSSVVVVQAFYNRERTSAQQWPAQASFRLAGAFPQAAVEKSQQYKRQPDEALAALTYKVGGQPARAVLLCSVADRSGMLYGLGALVQGCAARCAELLRILRSFSFAQPAAAPGRGAGRPAAALQYVPWQDPHEGAFSMEVPTRWRVNGGMFRLAPADTRSAMEVVSPDSRVRITGGDQNIPPFFVPNQTSAMTGQREGSWYSSPYGVKMMIRLYVPGLAFAREYVKATIEGRWRQGVQFTDTRDRRDLSARVTSTYSQIGGGILSQQVTFGEVMFRCTACGASSEIVAKTHAEISKGMLDNFNQRQHSWDELSRKRSNVILGQTDVRDPETGETWNVTSGHNYYWRKDYTDAVVGTNTYERPDTNFSPLEEY